MLFFSSPLVPFTSHSHELGSGSHGVDTQGDNINIMSRFCARQWRASSRGSSYSETRFDWKGLGDLIHRGIHGRRFLWAT